MTYLIVGGGVAGTTAAEELRKIDKRAEIILISREHAPLYSRVLLPPYIKGTIPRERVFIKKENWYKDNNIEWLPGLEAVKCDPQNKFVELSDGRELPYDKLLIATGSEPRVLPGTEQRGVNYLRNLDDADQLIQLIKERKKGDKAAVYGGGLIACEYLNLFIAHGLKTAAAFRGKHFWTKNINEPAGEFLNHHLRAQGVEVITDANFVGVEGGKELTGLKLENQTVPCSILGIGAGVDAELDWVKETRVEAGRGIKVNEFLETNFADIWAAGDAAEYFDLIAGRHIMFGNWQKSMSQGRVAAKNMAGERTAFRQVPTYAMNVLGLDATFIGDVEISAADQVLERRGDDKGPTLMLVRENKLVGAVILGRNLDRVPLTKAIDDGTANLRKVESWQALDREISA